MHAPSGSVPSLARPDGGWGEAVAELPSHDERKPGEKVSPRRALTDHGICFKHHFFGHGSEHMVSREGLLSRKYQSTPDLREAKLWMRGGLPMYGARIGKTIHPVDGRPKWNRSRFDTSINNPVYPKTRKFALEIDPGTKKLKPPHRSASDFRLSGSKMTRDYLSHPQKMP